MAQWIGLCSAANTMADAAKDVGNKLGDAPFKAVNYWSWLLERYHAGTPAEKDWARKVIMGSLGIDPDQGLKGKFEIALAFTGVDTRRTPLRVALLEDSGSPDDIKRTIEAGERDAMGDFRPLNPQSIAPLQRAAYSADVDAAVTKVLEQWDNKMFDCSRFADPGPCARAIPVQTQKQRDVIRKAISVAINPDVVRAAGTEVRFPWNLAPLITILIPKHDLDAQPHLGLALTIYRVSDDGTRTPTDRFRNARQYSWQDLTQGGQVYSSRGKFFEGKNAYYGRRIEIYSP